MAKTWKDLTEAEKEVIRGKKKDALAKRDADTKAGFEALEKACAKNPEAIALIKSLRQLTGVDRMERGGSAGTGYLTKIFGSAEPKVGQVVSFLEAGVRGPNGERPNAGEELGKFVTRVGDMQVIADAGTLSKWVWALKTQGYDVAFDRASSTLTYKGLLETGVAVAE